MCSTSSESGDQCRRHPRSLGSSGQRELVSRGASVPLGHQGADMAGIACTLLLNHHHHDPNCVQLEQMSALVSLFAQILS